MGSHSRTELAVGLFLVAGLGALGYLSISIAGVRVMAVRRYPLTARFASVGALRPGAAVAIAGVSVGRVRKVGLVHYAAEATLEIDEAVRLPVDTIASIRTLGLLGETYVSLSPGASDRFLAAGGRISQTEPALDLMDLIGRYAFKGKQDAGDDLGP